MKIIDNVKNTLIEHSVQHNINPKVIDVIKESIKKHTKLAPVVKNSNCITTNIRNGYYSANKYLKIHKDLKECGYTEIYSDVENAINETSNPTDYKKDIKNTKTFLHHLLREQSKEKQNDDYWDTDFMKEYNISRNVMDKISFIIWDSNIDYKNKAIFAKSLLDLYKMDR